MVPRLAEVVPGPPCGVVGQLPDRDCARALIVADAEAGQVVTHRGVEVEPAGVDKLHRDGGGEGLGRRPDLEERVHVDLERVVHAGDAGDGDVLLAVEPHPGRRTGAPGALGDVVEDVLQTCVHAVSLL